MINNQNSISVSAFLVKKCTLIYRLAQKYDTRVFLVGGLVRDLLSSNQSLSTARRRHSLWRRSTNQDLDITIENSYQKFAEELAYELKAMITHHPYFMTMNLQWKDGSHIDIAQARTERYPKPAILPKASPAKIEEDLKRRDFSINAIAMEITAKLPYPIYDPFDGRGDLEKKLIRVLHPKSFIDDPTRIFRAIRFATRFRFKIEPLTTSLMQEAIKNNLLKLLSKERILNEIKLMLAEQKHIENIRCLQNYGIIANLFDLNLPKRFFDNNDKLTAYESDIKKIRLIYFLSYLPISHWRKYPLTTEIVESTYALIKFSKIRGHLAKAKKPSEIYKILKPLPIMVLEILSSIESQTIKEKVKKYLNEYSKITISTNGNVLRSMKIQQGQLYTQILKQIRYEKLDGKIKTKQDEINYIKMKYG